VTEQTERVSDGAPVGRVAAKDALGAYGERLAGDHLVAAGMTLLARNWRCPIGEIDIVARDGDVLVICEVKTRSSTAFGHPLEAVSARKAARLRRLAAAWITETGVHPADVRIDLVGVLRPPRGAAAVEHVRGVG
jgi:putative endonuclease